MRPVAVWLCSAPWCKYAHCAAGRAFLLRFHLLFFFLYLSENGLWHLMKPDRFSLCVEWNCCSFSDFTRLWTNNIQHTEWIHLHALALLRWYGVLLYIFSDAKVNLPCVQLHMERTAHTCRLLVLYSMFYIMEITAIHASAKKNTILRNIKYRAWVEKIIPI